VVRLLYERGQFGPEATEGTAVALVFYAFGLVAYTSVKVLAPAFYALGSPRTPLLASALAVITNVLVNMALYERFGFRAVALGTSLGSIANAVLLVAVLERRLGGIVERATLGRLGRMGAAAGAMAIALLPVSRFLEASFTSGTLLAHAVTGLVPVSLGVLVYLGLALLFRLPEASELASQVRRTVSRAGG